MLDDGTAYIPMYDGTSIVINEEVKSAILTKDRKHIVVLLKDGTLYVTNKELSEKNTIDDYCLFIFSVSDDGFFYMDLSGSIYRILFVDYSSVHIEKAAQISVAQDNTLQISCAQDNTTVLYATDDGKIYSMLSTAAERTKAGTYSDSIELEAISNDGQISLWVTEKNDVQTIVLNDGDNKTTLGEVDCEYNDTYATFSKDQKIIVITNSYSEEMWIKTVGSDPITVKLGATPESSTIYTENGMLADENASTVTAFYISTEGDSGTNLYHISIDGDRERVLSKVSDYAIANGKIFYTNDDDILYCAELHGSEVSNEIKISSDVDMFEMTDNGKFIYYAKDYDDGVANLYCYKVGEKEPVKISSDVACYWAWLQTTYSTDGATVFFFKDEEEIDDTYYSNGTLMKWSYGSESAEKIASEVLLDSVSGALDSGEVDPASFMYMKYTSVDKEENILVNWMYFNGKESVKVATDIPLS